MRSRICVFVLASVASSFAGCVQLGTPSNSDSEPSGGGASANAGKAGAPSVSGVQCGLDPSFGVSLCLGISSCPSVRVDPDQLPDCGFRIAGATIDLQCLCGDSLCPVGLAATCSDARALLVEQSAQGVCAGVAEGRCRTLQARPNTMSTCDTECRTQCSGVPGCLSLCGC